MWSGKKFTEPKCWTNLFLNLILKYFEIWTLSGIVGIFSQSLKAFLCYSPKNLVLSCNTALKVYKIIPWYLRLWSRGGLLPDDLRGDGGEQGLRPRQVHQQWGRSTGQAPPHRQRGGEWGWSTVHTSVVWIRIVFMPIRIRILVKVGKSYKGGGGLY